jgi:hypothetical protein
LSRQKGWPQEGYVQTFWRDPTVPAKEKDRYRLPKVGGKKYVSFHPNQVQRPKETDLRWIAQAFPNLDGVLSQAAPEIPTA